MPCQFSVVFVLVMCLKSAVCRDEHRKIVSTCRRTRQLNVTHYHYYTVTYYTVGQSRLTKDEAHDECQHNHPNGGRLTAILDAKSRECLNRARSLTSYPYWIGAHMNLLQQWTWADGSTAVDTNWLTIPSNGVGFARLVIGIDEQHISYEFIPLYDPPSTNASHGLCQLNKMECTRSTLSGCYFNVSANRWFRARNKCQQRNGDLAVLTTETVGVLMYSRVISKSHAYYIGLMNVKFSWPSGAEENVNQDVIYSNWVDTAPRTTDERCVVMRNGTDWDAANCSARHTFICEYLQDSWISAKPTTSRTSTSTSPHTTQTTSIATRSSADSSSPTQTSHYTSTESENHRVHGSTFIAVAAALIALFTIGVVIVACVIIKKKSSAKPETLEPYDKLQEKQKQGVCLHQTSEPTYADIISTEGQHYPALRSGHPPARQHKSSGVTATTAAESGGTVYASIILPARETDHEETNDYETPVQQVVYASMDCN